MSLWRISEDTNELLPAKKAQLLTTLPAFRHSTENMLRGAPVDEQPALVTHTHFQDSLDCMNTSSTQMEPQKHYRKTTFCEKYQSTVCMCLVW